ncbi:MAG: GNAT family N-acetyltransferase [Gemmatimonadaceae bacterium]
MDDHPPTPAQRPREKPIPPVTTRRLVLRAFGAVDAARVEAIINDDAIAAGTLTIPFPYPAGAALPWIEGHAASWAAGKSITWAVTRRHDDVVIGALSLRLAPAHHRGELGYWIARAEWGRGYATEALRGAIAFAFDDLQLHRVDAHHFVENPASGRVMLKAGMTHEGRRRGAVFRAGVPRDLEEYAILRTDPRTSD